MSGSEGGLMDELGCGRVLVVKRREHEAGFWVYHESEAEHPGRLPCSERSEIGTGLSLGKRPPEEYIWETREVSFDGGEKHSTL